MIEPLVSEVSPELHHYTNWGGLEGIQKSNALWAVRFDLMNDPGEFLFAKQVLIRELMPRMRPILSHTDRRRLAAEQGANPLSLDALVATTATGWVESHFKAHLWRNGDEVTPFAVPFITCFCDHTADMEYERQNGLLSQWRGYGDDSAFAIVFDTKKLEELLAKEFSTYGYFDASMHDVIYDREIEMTKGKVANLVQLMTDEFSQTMNAKPKPPSTSESYSLQFKLLAGQLKHQGYHEEREIRIIAYPLQEKFRDIRVAEGVTDMATVVLKKISEVRKSHIVLFEDMNLKLPIKRIIIGPTNGQEAYAEKIRALDSDVRIHISETPYRPKSTI